MAIQFDWTPVKLMQYDLKSEQFNSTKQILQFPVASWSPPLLRAAQRSFTHLTFCNSIETYNCFFFKLTKLPNGFFDN